PAEVKVDSRRVEPPPEIGGRALGPSSARVLALAQAHDSRPPSIPFGQSRQIDLARGEGGRFPVDGKDPVAAQQDRLRVELAVDDGRRRREQRRTPLITALAELLEPGEAPAQGTGELGRPARPAVEVVL